jgi:hypothetical protein
MMWQGRSVPTSQYPNRLVEFFGEDFYSKNRRAGGRQLNGERNAVKALTHATSERQVGVVSAKAWFDGAYASEKQLNCASPRNRSIRVIIARHLQRYNMVQTLTVNAQRFPTRGKYLAAGIEPGKHMGELSDFCNDVFAIVQNEQCWLFIDQVNDSFRCMFAIWTRETHGACHCGGKGARGIPPGHFDHPDPPFKLTEMASANFGGEAGLAYSACADQGHDVVSAEQLTNLSQRRVAPDQLST